jgi:hypothetical protein
MSLELVIAAAMLVSLTVYALLGGADYGGGVWDLFRARAESCRPARFDCTRHRPDLGGQPRLAHSGSCHSIYRVPSGVRDNRHCAAHSPHAVTDRHRVARFGIHVSHVRLAARQCAETLEPRLFNGKHHYSRSPGHYRRSNCFGNDSDGEGNYCFNVYLSLDGAFSVRGRGFRPLTVRLSCGGLSNTGDEGSRVAG